MNIPALQDTWQQVIDHHAALRTGFFWDELDKPLQVVYKRLLLPWTTHDWHGCADVQSRLGAFLAEDRQHGFHLDQPPLMRYTLMQAGDETSYLVWSVHHLLVDGWSLSILLQEVTMLYGAAVRTERAPIKIPRHYCDYIAWLQRQDISKAEAFWRASLQDFDAPTPFNVDLPNRPHTLEASYAAQRWTLPAALQQGLTALGQRHELTLNTIFQGAWALLLARYSGNQDVLFGATVAGRPFTLAGVEAMVGLFINTLPVRVTVSPTQPLLPWLQELQQAQIAAQEYAYVSLVDIQSWSAVRHGVPLFESLLVFENYPLEVEQTDTVKLIKDIRSYEQTNFPLTLELMPGAELSLTVSYNA